MRQNTWEKCILKFQMLSLACMQMKNRLKDIKGSEWTLYGFVSHLQMGTPAFESDAYIAFDLL